MDIYLVVAALLSIVFALYFLGLVLKADDKIAVLKTTIVALQSDVKFYKDRSEKLQGENIKVVGRVVDLEFENNELRNLNAVLDKRIFERNVDYLKLDSQFRETDGLLGRYLYALQLISTGHAAPKHNYKKWAKQLAKEVLEG